MIKPFYRFLTWIVATLCLTLLVVGAGMAANGKSKALCPPPLPEDGLHQVTPDPNLPADIKAFYGNWQGQWNEGRGEPPHGVPTILVVEEIVSPEKVMVVLGWGECPICKTPAGCQRFWARIVTVQGKKALFFGFPDSKTYSFTLEGDRLVGTDGTGQVTMHRLGP